MTEPTTSLEALGARRPWRSESWAEFRDAAADEPAWLIRGWLPEGALAFLAAPPKKGKTWAGLGISLAVATGRLFGTLAVPEGGRAVLYVALEGSRQALRARIGALARGIGLDPDADGCFRAAADAVPAEAVQSRRPRRRAMAPR